MKTRDFLRVGARICCRSDINALGVLYSDTELAIVAVYSQYKRQSFSLEYRAVDAAMVPYGGRAEFSQVEDSKPKGKKAHSSSSSSASDEEHNGERGNSGNTGEKKSGPVCQDVAGNCYSLLNLCDDNNYRDLMKQQCLKTCMKCPPRGGGGNGGGTNIKGNGGTGTGKKGSARVCGEEHKNCGAWDKNGFCTSPHYTEQVKREICPKTCKFC